MQKIVPYLWFNDQAEEAARFYTSLFKNGRMGDVTLYPGDVQGGEKGKVMDVSFELAGQEFFALNGGPEFSFNPAISFSVSCETEEELDRLWAALSEGGGVLMELGPYPFSEKYGWLADRYGVSWQLSLARIPQQITPSFLFVGDQAGKAEEAIRLYTSLFENSGIDHLERYEKGQGEPEGSLQFALFRLNGQAFTAMDSSLEHKFTFTHAVSLLVNCKDQAEVDHFWNALTQGGQEEPCGWLLDRYGVSWQVIPTALGELLSDPDAEKAGRVLQAMLQMKKIDVSLLEQAYEGVH